MATGVNSTEAGTSANQNTQEVAAGGGSSAEKWKKQVMLGELPPSFLRFGDDGIRGPIDLDAEIAQAYAQQLAYHQQQMVPPAAVGNASGRLSITVAQAKLNKSYAMMGLRMDPYCRVRIGNHVFETHTDNNGAKNPHWNKTVQCYVDATSIKALYIEVFDEKAITEDERIAWGHYTIPDTVFSGEPLDDWFHLSGKLGDDKEGMIHIILTYTPVTAAPLLYPGPVMMPMQQPVYYPAPGMYPPGVPMQMGGMPMQPGPPIQGQPQQQQQPMQQPVAYTEEDVKQVQDMFPNIDSEVITSVFEEKRGNKDLVINSLLQMIE